MFTGIIEGVGLVKRTAPLGEGALLCIDLGPLAEGTNPGDSIAVNGVCLTAARITSRLAEFEISSQTLMQTTLARLRAGAKVNLERAMAAGGRFGGHIVQGHIDGTAKVKAIERQKDFAVIRFTAGGELLEQMVAKGSVAADGISLTIAGLDGSGFSVAVIPTTLENTTLGSLSAGDAVNIETDLIVRVIKKQLESLLPDAGKGRLTEDKLRQSGLWGTV